VLRVKTQSNPPIGARPPLPTVPHAPFLDHDVDEHYNAPPEVGLLFP